jgi:hypothetical protein
MNESVAETKGVFRIKDWWGKASLLMGMIYLFAARYQISFEKFIPLAILSFTTIAGFASMGYLFNDLFDIKKDALAGKRNFLADKSVPAILFLFLVSATFVFAPWYFLPKTSFSFILIEVQLSLFIIYSAPPIRLKERGAAGIITDALYAHGLPSFLAVYTFSLAAVKAFPTPDIIVLLIWQTISGVRNIVLHQWSDLEADKKSGSKNFVAGLSQTRIHLLIRGLTTTELLCSLFFFGNLVHLSLWFIICLSVILGLSAWAVFLYDKMGVSAFFASDWRFFPNNVYEKWLPVAYLAILSISDLRFLLLLFFHQALFNFSLYQHIGDWLYGRWKSIPFKGHLITVRIFLSYPGNYLIYYVFRIFGVDLKKENTSALAYFRKHRGGKQDVSEHNSR